MKCRAKLGVWACELALFHRENHTAVGVRGTRFFWDKRDDLLIQFPGHSDFVSPDDLVDQRNEGRDTGPSPGPPSNDVLGMSEDEEWAWLQASDRSYGVLVSVAGVPARLLPRRFDTDKRRTLGNKVRRKAYGRRWASKNP